MSPMPVPAVESFIAPATMYAKVVIPAKAGIQTSSRRKPGTSNNWMPDQVRHAILSVWLPE
jgi:hypothetical protein